jgi:sialate O-acetylesterase
MKLAALFSDHAVLQRGRPAPVWGWTRPLLRVRVRLGDAVADTQAAADGRFLARLPPMPAGGPRTLTVETPDPGERAVVKDVMVGEVWVCSGQSNMEWTLAATGADGEAEAARADLPALRHIAVPRIARWGRQPDADAVWQVCRPETAPAFTAVGYHFGRALRQALDVPVGLVNASWGGTRIEAWMSRETMVEEPELRLEVERHEATLNSPAYWDAVDPFDPADPAQSAACAPQAAYPADPGNKGVGRGWARPDFDDTAWPVMNLPGTWQNAGHKHSGVFWFRRAVAVPPAWAGRDLLLGTGAIDKLDVTYFNGEQVGATGRGFEEHHWNVPRVYRVPGRLVRPGRNTIAVRANSFAYDGGMIGPANTMFLALADGDGQDRLPLAGDWRYAVEHDFGVVQPARKPYGPGNPDSPGILFDNMIAPLLPCAIRGAIWYQGESNAGNAIRYGALLRRLIRDWRHLWGQGDFPFLIVQLANFQAPRHYQENSTWALVREGQLEALKMPGTGLAVAIDIGEAADIHPRNKREVGRRLARWALTRVYGRPGVAGGPLYDGATIEPDGIRVRFRDVGGGLTTRDGGPLKTFVIAGPERKFLPAAAEIQDDTVFVANPQVSEPMAVRYAWADNPDGANLINAEGFPASPFRTDAWL